MATTHVFIVDTNTFKYHIEYMFAGTGAKDNYIDFNDRAITKLHPPTENNLVGMIADSQRVRKNDYVIFYLQQNKRERVYEGKFYGIFKIKHDLSFLDNNDDKQYLKEKLKKSLTFRVLIEPFEVYPEGVTEWEALDEIKHIQSPNQMLWSLIYRKLKGNRGNTMITIYETDRLFQLIRNKNQSIQLSGKSFTFDKNTQQIKVADKINDYKGRKERINILPRLINKYNQKKAFEAHLQAYIVQNIGKNTNESLDNCLIPRNTKLEWMGNEVSCGVGMQRIDILLSFNKNIHNRILMPIELKAAEVESSVVNQMQRYIDWVEQYYLPNKPSSVQPVLISMEIKNKNTEQYRHLIESFKVFNSKNHNNLPLKYIEYVMAENNLFFKEIKY